MRLIDADAIIKEIKARNPDDVSYEDAWAITCIEHAPTIEPEQTCEYWDSESNFCALCRPAAAEGDCISRKATIDAINTWDKFGVDERCRIVKWHEGLEPYVHLRDVVITIANSPSAQPLQWIPCSERLPKALQEVIVTSTSGYVYTSRIAHGDFEYGGNVIAWMPLPEPYKEGSE